MEKVLSENRNNLKDGLLKYELHFYMRDKNYCLDEKTRKGRTSLQIPKK